MPKLRITLVKSSSGFRETQKATIRTLGLRHLNQSVEQESNASVLGMISRVKHLVKVEEI